MAPFMAMQGGAGDIDVDMDAFDTESMTGPTDLLADSSLHDRDFERLRRCFDPSTCVGMNRKSWRGSLDGCWEGNFSFFEFEAFRDMVAGQSRALYEGPFGEQAQVWRLKETFVRPGKGKGKALPLNGPVTNAGFPTDQPPSTGAGLASAAAEAATLRETIRQQVEAIQGHEIVPDAELDEMLERPEEGLEMLLTGTGHSAWGRFILKGRVRAWDGMATLVKEYAVSSSARHG
jgi:predicted RNA-binding Zn ribbon-like protein